MTIPRPHRQASSWVGPVALGLAVIFIFAIIALFNPVRAETRPTQKAPRVVRDVTPSFAHIGETQQFSARRHVIYLGMRHHLRGTSDANGNRVSRRSGACDGFQRCRCGTTAARYHGLPYNYIGYNLKKASEWARAFQHTSFGVGVVGVKPHHVLTVVGGSSCGAATVHDDRGTYQRNVCNMTFVAVGG